MKSAVQSMSVGIRNSPTGTAKNRKPSGKASARAIARSQHRPDRERNHRDHRELRDAVHAAASSPSSQTAPSAGDAEQRRKAGLGDDGRDALRARARQVERQSARPRSRARTSPTAPRSPPSMRPCAPNSTRAPRTRSATTTTPARHRAAALRPSAATMSSRQWRTESHVGCGARPLPGTARTAAPRSRERVERRQVRRPVRSRASTRVRAAARHAPPPSRLGPSARSILRANSSASAAVSKSTPRSADSAAAAQSDATTGRRHRHRLQHLVLDAARHPQRRDDTRACSDTAAHPARARSRPRPRRRRARCTAARRAHADDVEARPRRALARSPARLRSRTR